MGMESYLVRLSGDSSELGSIVPFVECELGLVVDSEPYSAHGERYYSYRDGRHVIEFELSTRESRLQISARFALCNPPTVDRVFIGLLTQLLERFALTAILGDASDPRKVVEHTSATLEAFASHCREEIGVEREHWRAMFGSKEAGISVSEALRTFVMPHCEPVHS